MPRLFETTADNNPNTANRVAFGRVGFAALYMTFVNFFIYLADNLRNAAEGVKGVLEVATQAETTTGTNDAKAITPLKLETRLTGGLKTAIIDIGDWDMDANLLPAVTPVHGLTLADIRSVQAYIRADVDAGLPGAVHPIWAAATGSANDAGGVVNAQTVNIGLSRRTGGFFDSADFNATSYNRGWIIIEYV